VSIDSDIFLTYRYRAMSKVSYPAGFELQYKTIPSHSSHPPTKMTNEGRIWEKKLYNIYSKYLSKNDIALDIGSYIGTHGLPMSKFAKNVFCFEPNTEIFNCLRSNILLNKIDTITPLKIALYDSKGSQTFYERNTGTSRLATVGKKGGTSRVTEVYTDTIDNLFKTVNNCRLIKLDVEGAEYKVLEGAKDFLKRNKPLLLVETFKITRDKLYEWAEDNDYSIKHIGGDDYVLMPL